MTPSKSNRQHDAYDGRKAQSITRGWAKSHPRSAAYITNPARLASPRPKNRTRLHRIVTAVTMMMAPQDRHSGMDDMEIMTTATTTTGNPPPSPHKNHAEAPRMHTKSSPRPWAKVLSWMLETERLPGLSISPFISQLPSLHVTVRFQSAISVNIASLRVENLVGHLQGQLLVKLLSKTQRDIDLRFLTSCAHGIESSTIR